MKDLIAYKEGDSKCLSEVFMQGLIGKYVHAPVNMVVKPDALDAKAEPVNAWFAGMVAGFQRSVLGFDFVETVFTEGVKSVYHILLTDGMAYPVSPTEITLVEMEEDEFMKFVEEHVSKQAAKDKILLPGRNF